MDTRKHDLRPSIHPRATVRARFACSAQTASGHEKIRVCGQLPRGSRSSFLQSRGTLWPGWLVLFCGVSRRVVTQAADVRDLAALSAAVDAGVAELGRLDIVLANAGIAPSMTLAVDPAASWRNVIDVNLTGVWNTAYATKGAIARGKRGAQHIRRAEHLALHVEAGLVIKAHLPGDDRVGERHDRRVADAERPRLPRGTQA